MYRTVSGKKLRTMMKEMTEGERLWVNDCLWTVTNGTFEMSINGWVFECLGRDMISTARFPDDQLYDVTVAVPTDHKGEP